jgi:hypothetical protein
MEKSEKTVIMWAKSLSYQHVTDQKTGESRFIDVKKCY